MGRVLRGGTVVTAQREDKLDIRMDGERIAAVGAVVERNGDDILDVSGCYLFPGGIDPHTHFDLDAGGTVTSDDFASGTRAALRGGTTTIIDYATQSRQGSVKDTLALWHRKADNVSFTDYGFHVALCECNDMVLQELRGLPSAGVTSVKLYLAYKNVMQLDDASLLKVMRVCREQGLVVCLHCENGDVIAELISEAKLAGRFDPAQHAASRPEAVEAEAVFRAVCLAELAGCMLYVVHVSSGRALSLIVSARQNGLPVLAETCPQYLLLDESRYELPGFEAAKYVMSPPLRKKENQAILWQGIAKGDLTCIASDHCAFNYIGQKELGRDDFSRIPNGIPGVENRFGLLYTYGVVGGRISLQDFVAATSTAAAQTFGLFPRKGMLAPGSDADIVVWDPDADLTIEAEKQLQNVDYNPYGGFRQIGDARHVFLRGHHVVTEGKVNGSPLGKYMPRQTAVFGRAPDVPVYR